MDQTPLPHPDASFGRAEGRRRVLIECSDPCLAWAAAEELRRGGFEVATCWALGSGGPPRCPVTEGRRCVLVAQADVIVRAFAGREAQHEAIVEAVDRAAPETPVCLLTSDGAGWIPVHPALGRHSLLDAVGVAVELLEPEAPGGLVT